MALKFERPDVERQKTTEEALLEPITQAVQTLPALYAQYKIQRQEQDLKRQELAMKKRELESKYGTNAPAPMQPGQLTSQIPGGPEEQMLGFTASPPSLAPEAPEARMGRIGTEAYGAETARIKAEQEKPAPQYAIPQYDAQGNVTGYSSVPEGMKPFGGRGPQKPVSGAAGGGPGKRFENTFEKDFDNAFEFLSRMRQNRDRLQQDVDEGSKGSKRKIFVGPVDPRANQGFLGRMSRKFSTKEQSAFAADVGKVEDSYRRVTTGAAAPFAELGLLRERLPGTDINEEQFQERADTSIKDGLKYLVKGLERAKSKGMDTTEYERQLEEEFGDIIGAEEQSPKQTTGPSTVPSVGSMFNGQKVRNVTRIE